MLAMSDLYGIEGINAGVPEIVNIKLEGNKYIVEFAHGKGLMTPPYEAVAGFEVAGEDKLFYPAKAKLRGDKIEVTVPQEITSPQSLRYSFRDYDTYKGIGGGTYVLVLILTVILPVAATGVCAFVVLRRRKHQ